MADLKSLYQKYEQEFQDIQEARSVYIQQKKSFNIEAQKLDNRYVDLLQKSLSDSLHKSIEELVHECQSAVDEALNNLSPDTDTDTMQSLINLEDMVISIQNEMSEKQESTSESVVNSSAVADFNEPQTIIAPMEDKWSTPVIRKKILDDEDDEDNADSVSKTNTNVESVNIAITDLQRTLTAKKQNNVKGAILLVTRRLQNANMQFKKIGVKAYLGLSDARESIFRALQEQNLSDEIEFNQRVHMIAKGLPKEDIIESKTKPKLFGFWGERHISKAARSLEEMKERIYEQLAESNKRITEIIQSEINSMTKTIDTSERIIRGTKDKTFEDEIKRAETQKLLNHVVRIMSAMQGDRVFLVGYEDMAITKTDEKIGFIKNGSVVSKEEFMQAMSGHSRMFSQKFEVFAKKEAFEKGLTQEQIEEKTEPSCDEEELIR